MAGYNHDLWISISEVSDSGFRVNGTVKLAPNSFNAQGFNCYTEANGQRNNHTIKIPNRGGSASFSNYYNVGQAKDGRNFNCKVGADLSWSSRPVDQGNPVSANAWVPGRTYNAHGTPSFNSSLTSVFQGERIKLTWAKASEQGNANFERFELAMGGKGLYSGSDTSYTITPSDWTGSDGGDLTFTLKEVHEWYGTYPSTQKSITVHVLKNHGNPTVYSDRNGYYQGEQATISWGRAANQGNSTLDRFELWRGGTKLYSGKGTSYKETPSNVTGSNGGSVTYTVKEIHEFWGRYKTTESSKSISVIKNHGTPRLTASKSPCNYSESVTLGFQKASEQGNAQFDRFELYQGSNKLYSGSGTSYKVTPSDYSGPRGGNVLFKLKEVHEWWGRYPVTETTLNVNVRSGVVSAYDTSGNKHTGLVTVYDSSGKLHYVLLTAYDKDGKAHSVV